MSEPAVPLRNVLEPEPKRPEYVGPSGTTDRELPPGPAEERPSLRETAGNVGSAVGRAVGKVRRTLPQRVAEMRERFTVIRGRTREDVATTADEMKETAKQKVWRTRTHAQRLAHEHPIEFILGVGATAFVVGFALRIWRSSRRGY